MARRRKRKTGVKGCVMRARSLRAAKKCVGGKKRRKCRGKCRRKRR